MTTTEPTGFTCPTCGAHGGEPSVGVDTELIREYPKVALWDGGPVVEDRSQLPETRSGERTLSTDVCGCTFKLSEWGLHMYRHEESGREWMELTPKQPAVAP